MLRKALRCRRRFPACATQYPITPDGRSLHHWDRGHAQARYQTPEATDCSARAALTDEGRETRGLGHDTTPVSVECQVGWRLEVNPSIHERAPNGVVCCLVLLLLHFVRVLRSCSSQSQQPAA
jgi:hypothetical protein